MTHDSSAEWWLHQVYREQLQLNIYNLLVFCPGQVSEAWPAVVAGGGCHGDREDDPPSPHRIPRSCGVGPFHRVRRPAPANHDVGPGPAQRGLSHSDDLGSGSRLRRGGDGERLELLLWQVAVVGGCHVVFSSGFPASAASISRSRSRG